ncbi:MAG: hypothetical protein KDA49_18800 [Rhodospirillaceae bacterium]|nr:hypothetical protein [Rhodospirillaceae bacterium]
MGMHFGCPVVAVPSEAAIEAELRAHDEFMWRYRRTIARLKAEQQRPARPPDLIDCGPEYAFVGHPRAQQER